MNRFTVVLALAFLGSSARAQPYRVATAPVTMFPIPTPAATSYGITAGPDGNVWFEEHVGRVGRITPSGAITEFALPPSTAMGASMTSGSDGNLWLTASSIDGDVARITPSGVVSFVNVGSQSPLPIDIVSGPDGNLWVTVNETSPGSVFSLPYIDLVNPTTSLGANFSLQRQNAVVGLIEKGVNGDLWFTELYDSHIGRITTNGVITEFDTPGSIKYANADDIAVAPDGNVWFTRQGGLFRMTPQGAFTQLWSASNGPAYHVFLGPDQNVWFSASLGQINAIAFIAGGLITAVPLPALPNQIAVGPDGNIWFTSVNSNAIGRLNVASIAAIQPVPALSPWMLLLLPVVLSLIGVFVLSRHCVGFTIT